MEIKLLATIKDKDVFPDKKFGVINIWQPRPTVKIIALNEKNQLALITNRIISFYTLPGGGIDGDETIEQAAGREADEEINYLIDDIKIIGRTKEFRGRDKKEYDTYCVSAKTTQPSNKDTRTENEKDLDIRVEWFDLNQAFDILKTQEEKIKAGKVQFYHTSFDVVRDKIFIEHFIKNYDQQN
jgi:8-oxo-dGTP diphosphatase